VTDRPTDHVCVGLMANIHWHPLYALRRCAAQTETFAFAFATVSAGEMESPRPRPRPRAQAQAQARFQIPPQKESRNEQLDEESVGSARLSGPTAGRQAQEETHRASTKKKKWAQRE
jgi:hypothetical protein